MVSEDKLMVCLSRADLALKAQEWLIDWNGRDLDRILAGFAPHASFRSPHAKAITGCDLVVGTDAMRRYWEIALARIEELHFSLVETVCDEAGQSLAVHYLAHLDDSRLHACEVFRFEHGLKISGEAFYGSQI